MESAVLFILLFGLLFLGVPVAVCLGLSSLLTIAIVYDGNVSGLAISFFDGAQKFTLMAIPFFILASCFMSTGGVARRIIRFAIASVGHIRGGMAIASVFACMLFAALSGSLGILIPPSIVMVVYAAATDVSVGRMFLAGVFPGLLAGLMLMAAIYINARMKGMQGLPFAGFKEWVVSFGSAFWGLLLIGVILGGPLKGVKWIKEGESIPAAIIRNALLILKYLIPSMFHTETRKVLLEGARTTIMLMFVIVNALMFAKALTALGIPMYLAELMLDAGFEWWSFLIAVNIMLLLGGQFMEPSGLLLIVAPLVFPIAVQLGVDPIHLGVMMVVNMEIGMITPPIGLNLFVTSAITGMSMVEVIKASLPFVAVMFIFLIIVTYIPAISTWLPTLILGPEIVTL